ncbi:MAG: tetratricopeptide repeat protein [Prevotellaceae bacterium]|jgi:tetratricopeptide (TPR) repeat protein|nr:tetratricopeptide repeat protein [Prevotellaceae bacterium]
MKKIFLFALILTVTQLGAQNKEADAVLKAYEKSKTELAGKKAQDAAAWVSFGKNITSVYDQPSKNLLIGLSTIEVKVVLKDQRSSGSEKQTVDGEEYEVVHYLDKDLYYDPNGILSFWVVTKHLMPQDLLSEAFDAFAKGYEFDAKGSQKKNLTEGLSNLQQRYITEAMTSYSLGNYSRSSQSFGKSIQCGEHPVLNKIDTIVVYYTGLTAFHAKEFERAITYLNRAIDMGFAQDGATYSFLAESYKALDQPEMFESTLTKGFTKYPSNQGILISLINMYRENDVDPEKVMEFIHVAQENEPNNESLFYAEADVWRKLGNTEKALELFEKSVEINPNYFFGYYSMGSLFYDLAYEAQNKASEELDDAKYYALLDELEANLLKAVEPFEKCFLLIEDPDAKAEIANYLKTIYYRMIGKNEELYTPLYEKYRDISEKK